MSQNSKLIIAVLITALLVGSGVYFWQQNAKLTESIEVEQAETVENTEETTEELTVSETDTSPSIYTNTQDGISFKMPENWGLVNIQSEENSNPEFGDASKTITFTSTLNAKKNFKILFFDPVLYPDGLPGTALLYQDSSLIIELSHPFTMPVDFIETSGNYTAEEIKELRESEDEIFKIYKSITNSVQASFRKL